MRLDVQVSGKTVAQRYRERDEYVIKYLSDADFTERDRSFVSRLSFMGCNMANGQSGFNLIVGLSLFRCFPGMALQLAPAFFDRFFAREQIERLGQGFVAHQVQYPELGQQGKVAG